MKALLFFSVLFVMSFSSVFASEDDLKLDAACSYLCNYSVETCYDGCWTTSKAVKKYVNIIDKSLEEIDTFKNGLNVRQVCLENVPAPGQWEHKIDFHSVSDFNCNYFKH